jgi:hypothetical protein
MHIQVGGFDRLCRLEAPILFQPDADFQSLDGSAIEPESWLEMPLKSERPIPFNCAVRILRIASVLSERRKAYNASQVTLPRPRKFSRCSSIPYFVVFTTTPKSSCLTKEISADATIVVSLVRKITTNPQHPQLLPSPPETPPASDESDGLSSPLVPRYRLLRRSAKPSTPPVSVFRTPRTPEEPYAATEKYKPLPELPQESFLETRILQTQVFIGFPKRPRIRSDLHSQQNLPDGVYKGELQLSKDMLPGVNWPGVSVKVRTVSVHEVYSRLTSISSITLTCQFCSVKTTCGLASLSGCINCARRGPGEEPSATLLAVSTSKPCRLLYLYDQSNLCPTNLLLQSSIFANCNIIHDYTTI